MINRGAAFFVALVSASAVQACDIALALAVDVSGSVDAEEYDIQMQGLAWALADPAVAESLVHANAQVMLLQWTGTGRQVVSIHWRSVDSFAAIADLAEDVAETPRRWSNFSTAIGEAIEVSLVHFEAPEAVGCMRHVLDISGDGFSNEGSAPQNARVIAAHHGVTINAIAIEESEAGLADYYRQNVIIGDGSFAVRAATFAEYPERMRQKLLREVVMQLAAQN